MFVPMKKNKLKSIIVSNLKSFEKFSKLNGSKLNEINEVPLQQGVWTIIY